MAGLMTFHPGSPAFGLHPQRQIPDAPPPRVVTGAVDYSRFYFVNGRLAGLGLYCLDCDDDDEVQWLHDEDGEPSDAPDLSDAIRSAEQHWADKHAPRT